MKGAGQSTDANLVDYSVPTVRATLWNEVSIYTHASLAVGERHAHKKYIH